ncbi:MAG: hypothetical protein ACP5MD_05975 [Verrucomicrobiia bacterium]
MYVSVVVAGEISGLGVFDKDDDRVHTKLEGLCVWLGTLNPNPRAED